MVKHDTSRKLMVSLLFLSVKKACDRLVRLWFMHTFYFTTLVGCRARIVYSSLRSHIYAVCISNIYAAQALGPLLASTSYENKFVAPAVELFIGASTLQH